MAIPSMMKQRTEIESASLVDCYRQEAIHVAGLSSIAVAVPAYHKVCILVHISYFFPKTDVPDAKIFFYVMAV